MLQSRGVFGPLLWWSPCSGTLPSAPDTVCSFSLKGFSKDVLTHYIRDWKHPVDVLNQISFPTTQMGPFFPSKEVLSCYFQCKPLWQRGRITRFWDLASCWCSAGVLGMLQASFQQSICMVMLFCSSCSVNSLASRYISKNTCPSLFAGAAAHLSHWTAPSSANNEPRVQL